MQCWFGSWAGPPATHRLLKSKIATQPASRQILHGLKTIAVTATLFSGQFQNHSHRIDSTPYWTAFNPFSGQVRASTPYCPKALLWKILVYSKYVGGSRCQNIDIVLNTSDDLKSSLTMPEGIGSTDCFHPLPIVALCCTVLRELCWIVRVAWSGIDTVETVVTALQGVNRVALGRVKAELIWAVGEVTGIM